MLLICLFVYKMQTMKEVILIAGKIYLTCKKLLQGKQQTTSQLTKIVEKLQSST